MYFLIIFFFLVVLGIPISFSIGMSSLAVLYIAGRESISHLIPQVLFTSLDTFPYLAIPGFILAGELMNYTGITDEIIDFLDKIVGHISGGLAHINILASILFAGLTGAAVSDTSALGSVLIPMMSEAGYDKKFSAAITAASSIIGPIIPPSIIMVIYSLTAGNVSIGTMFIAGIAPGLLIGIILMIMVVYYSKKRNYPKNEERATAKDMFLATIKAFKALLMPIIIIGGILAGVFTATEAAIVSVMYAFFIGFVVTKQLKISQLPEIFTHSAVVTSVVGMLISFAYVMGRVLTMQRIPQAIAETFTHYIDTPLMFLFVMVAIYMVMGLFLDPSAALVVIVPIVLPIAMQYGIHPLHFGIITIVALNLGLITPPVGVCLYVACSIGDIKLDKLSKEVIPFLFFEIFVLLMLVIFPELVLFIPRLVGLIS